MAATMGEFGRWHGPIEGLRCDQQRMYESIMRRQDEVMLRNYGPYGPFAQQQMRGMKYDVVVHDEAKKIHTCYHNKIPVKLRPYKAQLLNYYRQRNPEDRITTDHMETCCALEFFIKKYGK